MVKLEDIRSELRIVREELRKLRDVVDYVE